MAANSHFFPVNFFDMRFHGNDFFAFFRLCHGHHLLFFATYGDVVSLSCYALSALLCHYILSQCCLRSRQDCTPLAQIVSDDHQSILFCCGHNDETTRKVSQDRFRLCWHNEYLDELTDWDDRDIKDTLSVLAQALFYRCKPFAFHPSIPIIKQKKNP